MRRKQNKNGFTMAELLIVVAILVVLFAVVFIAVQNYRRSLTQLEYDTIAKEIFFAAQNHLTTAESQGYYGFEKDEGNREYGIHDDDDVYYIIVNRGSIDSKYRDMFDLMLPFGSIDETVRVGGDGCYLIRYQPSSATVMDVFYSRPDERYGVDLSVTDLSDLLTNYTTNRKNQRGVVGWFGDAAALQKGENLPTPVIAIHNEEKLWVTVQYTKKYETDQLCLILTGKNSDAQCKIMLGSAATDNRVVGTDKLTVILDDITTADMRFGSLSGQRIPAGSTTAKQFTPGEDIYVEAVAYNNDELTGVAYSGKQTTNSLFKGIYDSGTDSVAVIENFRHLENLSTEISGFNGSVNHAEQIQNLVWSGDGETSFRKRIVSLNNDGMIPEGQSVLPEEQVSVYYYVGTGASPTATPSAAGTYLPVNAGFDLVYSGKKHSLSNVIVNSSRGDAGLFGALNANSITIADLELIDFDIQTTAGNAGALAGSIQGTAAVSNVIAYNTSSFDNSKKNSGLPQATVSASASAGGLIGSLDGGGSVECCAAALTVQGGTTAGGLIGDVIATASSRMTINGCYSAGHTEKGEYYLHDASGRKGAVIYNVSGATAGGLIGKMKNAVVQYCYSTCSVSGSTAGGFAGLSVDGNGVSSSINYSYCTGRVSGGFAGNSIINNAFIGNNPANTTFGGNRFFKIINDVPKIEDGKVTEIKYKGSGGDAEMADKSADPFDEALADYISFVGSSWTDAFPYDTDLGNYYQNKYNLKSIVQLGAKPMNGEAIPVDYYAVKHHGDWPAPEVFIVNN